MKMYKKFAIQVVVFTMICVGFFIAINFTIEPYGLFRTDFNEQKIEPNQNFIKMKYVLNNPRKYDSFLFGSSRVGKIDVKKIVDGTYYNMTYSEGVPREHLNNIKIMLKRGVNIKNLLIGLDDFSYKVDPNIHFEQKMRYPYSENVFVYYFKYLFDFPSKENLDIYMSNDQPQFFTFYDIFDSGMPIVHGIEEWINSNQQQHINDPKFKEPTYYRGDRIRDTIADIKEIVRIAKQHQINLIVFINPIHQTTYLDADPNQFSVFKLKLATVTDYYDFSGLNSITTNNINYYETSHYRVNIGDFIVYTIFKDIVVDPKFGVYVSKDNIYEHLKNLHNEL